MRKMAKTRKAKIIMSRAKAKCKKAQMKEANRIAKNLRMMSRS